MIELRWLEEKLPELPLEKELGIRASTKRLQYRIPTSQPADWVDVPSISMEAQGLK